MTDFQRSYIKIVSEQQDILLLTDVMVNLQKGCDVIGYKILFKGPGRTMKILFDESLSLNEKTRLAKHFFDELDSFIESGKNKKVVGVSMNLS